MTQQGHDVLAEEVKAAFVFAYPLFAFAETRYRAVEDDVPDRHDPNTIRHDRALCDHLSHWITSPNNDTLYSNAWLDLSGGPVRIRAAQMPEGHYWSLALMDAFTNHFGAIGQRTDGTGPVDFHIVGPEHSGDLPGRAIIAPGHDAWLFCRCLVDGPNSLPVTHALQDGITMTPMFSTQGEARVAPKRPVTPANFLDMVNELLALNPVAPSETALLGGWAHLGLRPGSEGAYDALPPRSAPSGTKRSSPRTTRWPARVRQDAAISTDGSPPPRTSEISARITRCGHQLPLVDWVRWSRSKPCISSSIKMRTAAP